ncbi:5'-3' exonuclease [Herbiconiux sp. VKM Ac-1786]|uniref:5'-3' exonuclease n=1 Tax=Herbiconiux sp. VKM Ac-1786 TaxID=2783824 RepID=UPI00188A45B4|nr:5'-3' exonuclease [Herbiconiux sp. VKM Ac-1786]MBF4574182.1 5'-3' exonuclease [Herbiconiux sp. VKM Ac-1786]
MPPRLMLLDTASLYFRAFHGVPDTIRRSDGTPVNAVRGLMDMIARLVTEFEATSLIACWDDDWRPSWRVELVPGYKAHRVEREVAGGPDIETVPPGLTKQIPLIREVLGLAGIAVVGAPEHEADDVIGTYAATADGPVDVVTGDRDLFQLVDDDRGIRVIYTARGMKNLELVTDAVVVGKYRVLPDQYADYATLRGDTSDGLPGVAGIGEKTAAGLLGEYGTLEGLLAAATRGEPSPSVHAKLEAAADYLAVAPTVVEVVRDLDVPAPDEAGALLHPVTGADRERLEELAEEWNLGGAVKRLLTALDAKTAG